MRWALRSSSLESGIVSLERKVRTTNDASQLRFLGGQLELRGKLGGDYFDGPSASARAYRASCPVPDPRVRASRIVVRDQFTQVFRERPPGSGA